MDEELRLKFINTKIFNQRNMDNFDVVEVWLNEKKTIRLNKTPLRAIKIINCDF